MTKRLWTWLILLGLVGVVVFAQQAQKDIFKGSTTERLDALAFIQPGLGSVMIEYGNRFTDVYFAAHGGNWGLAQYQVKEMPEIQEVGEITRPQKAPMLKAFEQTYLLPLAKVIEKKDLTAFDQAFNSAIQGCNGCHVANGYSFINYKLPKAPVEAYLNFNLQTEPKYGETPQK